MRCSTLERVEQRAKNLLDASIYDETRPVFLTAICQEIDDVKESVLAVAKKIEALEQIIARMNAKSSCALMVE